MAQVRYDLARLLRNNAALRGARYPFMRGVVFERLAPRSLVTPLCAYAMVLGTALLTEWQLAKHGVRLEPANVGDNLKAILRDTASTLIATQVGILAIVSVAIGVVTLLSQREDGSSINTDIRLYYVESFSHELAVSGVGLALVLVFQLFWPFQYLLHRFHLGNENLTLKLGLTVVHTFWLSFNLLLFLQFMRTTFRFIEPQTREKLRERYTANDVIRPDAAKRLCSAIYSNAPEKLFGPGKIQTGPVISFGHGLVFPNESVAELTTSFVRPARLVDVRLTPLRFALQRWSRRAQHASTYESLPSEPFRQIAILANFDRTEDGRTTWVMRSGDVPLTRWERLLIRFSFRFIAIDEDRSDHPAPADFLNQLINKVVAQIGIAAPSGFRSSLDELVRYHRFILDAQNIQADDGLPMNLAEVGGMFSRPDQDWVRQYRPIYCAAANKITDDSAFMERLGSLPAHLMPRDAQKFSPRVIQSLLELSVNQVVILEAWVTAHTLPTSNDPTQTSTLAGSDNRAYANTLVAFVGSWEYILKSLIAAYEIYFDSQLKPMEKWATFGRAWPVLQTHLTHTAYFLGSAVWNNDENGADRYRDLLLHWMHPFHAYLQDQYRYHHRALLTPDNLSAPWPAAELAARRVQRRGNEPCLPGSVFGIILRGVHDDVIVLCAATFLTWAAAADQHSLKMARTARLLLQRKVLPGEESDLSQSQASPPQSIFRQAFDLLLRYELNSPYGDGNYSATLNGILRTLTGVAAKRQVSFRIYSSWGSDGFEALLPALFAILAANFPATGNDGACELICYLLENDPAFKNDEPHRHLISAIERFQKVLTTNEVAVEFDQLFTLLAPGQGSDAGRTRVHSFFGEIGTVLQSTRRNRLRSTPLDPIKINELRRVITAAVLTNGPDIWVFPHVLVKSVANDVVPRTSYDFGEIDRGTFSNPAMSDLHFDDLAPMIADIMRGYLANDIWQEMQGRPKRVVTAAIDEGVSAFWRSVVQQAKTIGPNPVVLVPYDILGADVSARAYRTDCLEEFSVASEPDMRSGGGTGYLGTLEGVRVFSFNRLTDVALLFPKSYIKELHYSEFAPTSFIVDFEFLDGVDPERSNARLTFAQQVIWDDHEFVEFRLVVAPREEI